MSVTPFVVAVKANKNKNLSCVYWRFIIVYGINKYIVRWFDEVVSFRFQRRNIPCTLTFKLWGRSALKLASERFWNRRTSWKWATSQLQGKCLSPFSIAIFIYYTEYKFLCLLRWVLCSVAVYQLACICSHGFKFYSVFNILAYMLGLFQCVSRPLFLWSPYTLTVKQFAPFL